MRKTRLRRFVSLPAIALGLLGLAVPFAHVDAIPSLGLTADNVIQETTNAMDEEIARFVALLGEVEAGKRTIREVVAENPEAFAAFCELADPAFKADVLAAIPFSEEICDAAEEFGVDSLLVAAVVEVESTFRPTAGSHKGAVGLMQLLPSTAGMPRQRLLDPETNLAAGAKYLGEMIERFDGDLELALAAYNAGPTNVRRYEGVPPFPETQNYVEKVLSIYTEHQRNAWTTTAEALTAGLTRSA